mmetsp:Transcript_40561/g.105284  ORF Transcript_40561/g.105284 Transcript_40561/m.105284 type:complete len:80 (-) Transcript_40561:949-1188(-)
MTTGRINQIANFGFPSERGRRNEFPHLSPARARGPRHECVTTRRLPNESQTIVVRPKFRKYRAMAAFPLQRREEEGRGM